MESNIGPMYLGRMLSCPKEHTHRSDQLVPVRRVPARDWIQQQIKLPCAIWHLAICRERAGGARPSREVPGKSNTACRVAVFQIGLK